MKSIGIEHAAEIVSRLDGDMQIDMFCASVDHFNLTDTTLITVTDFALMCGFLVVAAIHDQPKS